MRRYVMPLFTSALVLVGCADNKPVDKPVDKSTLEENVLNTEDNQELSPKREELYPKREELLPERLKIVLTNVSDRLSESEIRDIEYGKFLFDQLKQQKILSGNYSANARAVGGFESLIDRKLEIKRIDGLYYDYDIILETPISNEAQKDIDKFEKFNKGIGRHLQEQIKGPISKENFNSLINDYVMSYIPKDIDRFRRGSLIGRITATYKGKFKLVSGDEMIGDYSEDHIERVIEKIDLIDNKN